MPWRLLTVAAVSLTVAGWALEKGVARANRTQMPQFELFWENDPTQVVNVSGGKRLYVYSLPVSYRKCIDRIEPQLETFGWTYSSNTSLYQLDREDPARPGTVTGEITLAPHTRAFGDGSSRDEPGWVTFRVVLGHDRMTLLELIRRMFGI